jgi:small conductance mechanosensitive channel
MLQKFLDWLPGFGLTAIGRIIPFILILLVGLIVTRIITTIVNKALSKSKLEKAAHGLIKSLVRAVLFLLLGLIAASSLGIDVTGIIALASVLTLAVSLSVQNALTNVIGGITLLYTKPFKSGDFVEIAAESGTVQEIGMSYTKLQTPDNKIIYIPNSAVVSADIINYTVSGTRRVDFIVSASYNTPTQTVIQALHEAAKVPGVLTDPAPFAALNRYGENSIEYTLRVWTAAENYWDVNFAVNENIREAFQKGGVEFSYPHLNIHVAK